MELQDYVKVIAKHFYLVIFSVLLLVALAIYDYNKSPVSHSGSITFTLGNSTVSPNNTYNYDQYYNLAATGILSDNISGWLSSPNVISAIYNKAGIGMPGGKVVSLLRLFKTSKSSPESSVLVATYNNQYQDTTEKVLTAAGVVITEQFTQMQSSGLLPADLKISVSTPMVIADQKNLTMNIVLAIIAGLILGTVLAFAREAFKRA